MREPTLESLRCPKCRAQKSFELAAARRDAREVREGNVTCRQCRAQFPVHAGVIDLLPPEDMRPEVRSEIEGWIEAHKTWFDLEGKRGNFWLIEPDNNETRGISADEYIRRIPDYASIGPTFYKQDGYKVETHRELLELACPARGERVLELGAAKCWVSRDFAKKGCLCTALDIVTTRYIGLETSDVFFEADPDLHFERVRGDMESLPMADESFDVIYCSAVLHHSKQLAQIVSELRRILIPGGRVLVVNEPDFGMLDRKSVARDQQHEASNGVNENLYCQRDFVLRFRENGFETHFRPIHWLVKYRAWIMFEKLRKKKIPLPGRTVPFLEKFIYKRENLVRRFIGLGTMGYAIKR